MSTQSSISKDKVATASLRIFSEELGVEEITARVGVPASRSHSKGQPVSSRNPRVLRKQSMWALESPLGDDQDLATHLRWLLDTIEPRLEGLRELASNCRIDLFCCFSSRSGQGGTTLDRTLLARLGRLPLDLTIDLYPPGPITPDDTGS